MNVENFKEEFSKLLRQFAVPPNDKSSLSVVTSLTNQEILEAVQEVLGQKLDVTLVESTRDDVRTPAPGIVIMTPDAPDIPKINAEINGGFPGRYRSLDTLTVESLKYLSVDQLIIPEPGQLTAKNDDNNDVLTTNVPDVRLEQKKLISKSSPEVRTLIRSDTFVRDNDEFESVKNGDAFENKKTDKATMSDNSSKYSMQDLTELIKKMNSLKDLATDVVNKIDDIQNGVPENIRPIRRLSSIGGFPGLNRTSTASRTIQRPKMTRRSMEAFPGTPTSSRLSPGASGTANARRKSTSTLNLSNTGGSKLSVPSTHRSVSSGALVVKKKSPAPFAGPAGASLTAFKVKKTPVIRSPVLSIFNLSSTPDARQAKNPKYAHVQSTISKSGAIGKRKGN